MVKNANFCKLTGKNEGNASTLVMARLVTLLEVTSSDKESNEFKNRKRRNENDSDYTCNHTCNVKIITSACSRSKEILKLSSHEISYCKTVTSNDNHCNKKQNRK